MLSNRANKWLKCQIELICRIFFINAFKEIWILYLKELFFKSWIILLLLLLQWRRSISSSIPIARNCWRKWNRIWGGSWCRWWRLSWRNFLHRCRMTPGLRIKQSVDNCREQNLIHYCVVDVLLNCIATWERKKRSIFILRKSPPRYNEEPVTKLTIIDVTDECWLFYRYFQARKKFSRKSPRVNDLSCTWITRRAIYICGN